MQPPKPSQIPSHEMPPRPASPPVAERPVTPQPIHPEHPYLRNDGALAPPDAMTGQQLPTTTPRSIGAASTQAVMRPVAEGQPTGASEPSGEPSTPPHLVESTESANRPPTASEGGGKPPIETPPPVSGSPEGNEPEGVRMQCEADVQLSVNAIREKIVRGEPLNADDDAIGEIVADQIHAAATAGDIREVESSIDMLTKLPGVDPDAMARACMDGLAVRSDKVFHTLQGLLEADRLRHQEQRAAAAQTRPDQLRPGDTAPLLTAFVQVCEKHDILAQGWIDANTADDPEEQWRQYQGHYARLAAVEPEPGDEIQTITQQTAAYMLNEQAAKLLEPRAFDDAFVADVMPQVLAQTSDLQLREQLAARFTEIAPELPATLGVLDAYVATGQTIMRDPELASPSVVTALNTMIRDTTIALRDAGMDEYPLARMTMAWHIAVAEASNATPERIVEVVNDQLQPAFAAANFDGLTGIDRVNAIRNRGLTSTYRDQLFAERAADHAANGDFAAAKVFVGGIERARMLRKAMIESLRHATTPEEVATLRPDQLTITVNPDIALPVAIADARVARDVETLAAIGVRLAAELPLDENANSRTKISGDIQQAYQALMAVDPARATVFARDTLHRFRASGVEYPLTISRYFSDELIAAGDPQEPARAYAAIETADIDVLRRIQYRWQLAQKLANRS